MPLEPTACSCEIFSKETIWYSAKNLRILCYFYSTFLLQPNYGVRLQNSECW
jgi:hypothetical protein